MRYRSPYLTLGMGITLALTVSATDIAAQACTLEYRRADNMWANWGRADGYLGVETITLQPGQKRVFVTDWAYEKKANDGTNFYGSHLRMAVNRGTVPVQLSLRGPLQFIKGGLRGAMSAFGGPAPSAAVSIAKGSVPGLPPGDTALYRHDLAEVICPAAQATVTASMATAAPPPPAPVVLSLIGTPATLTTTSLSLTVQANDVATGAPLTGQVMINGATGATGQAITFNRCSETLELEGSRITRTRTIRIPCEGTVKISGYPDTYFTF